MEAGALTGILTALFSVVVVVVSIACPLLITAVTLFFVYRFMSKMKAQQGERNQLMTTGQQGSARIDRIAMGGMVTTVGVRRSLQVQLALTVHPDAPEAYTVATTTSIPELALPALQPGQTVPVRIDPANPQRLTIDLLAMGYADARQFM